MSDKRIEDWIHGRLVIETDERDIIIRVEPVEGGPTPTGEVIRLRLTAAQVMHMRGDGKPVGPKKLALELGLRRALQIGRVVGGTALFTTAGLLIKGCSATHWLIHTLLGWLQEPVWLRFWPCPLNGLQPCSAWSRYRLRLLLGRS